MHGTSDIRLERSHPCQLVEQLFQFMEKVKMIEVVYCSTVKEARTYRDLRPL